MKKDSLILSGLFLILSVAASGCKPHNNQKADNQIKTTDTTLADSSNKGDSVSSTLDRSGKDSEKASADSSSLKIKDITSQINFGYREANRGKKDIDVIVVHSNYHVVNQQKQIFDFDVNGCINQFRQGGVSAHYLITRDGTILKMVDEKNVSYHAGVSALPDGSRKFLNSTSIGIEVISMKRNGPTEAQYRALDALIKDICSRYNIRYLTRHSDVATPRGRKDDPWGMDWKRVTNSVKAVYPNIITYNIPVKNNPQFK